MKIVIADDERLARITLASMIGEMEDAWEIVGDAADGEELLDLVQRHHPDAAIVDIRMPKLDGLEAIRRGIELSPQTKWIITSGFSDFHYAQQAMKLGVNEYLLKPVVPDELQKAIRSVCEQKRAYALLLNDRFENRLHALVQGIASTDDEPADSLLRTGRFQALVFCFDSLFDAREMEAVRCAFNAAVRKEIPDCLVYGAHLSLFMLPETDLAVAAGVWDGERGQARQAVRSFLKHAEAMAGCFRNDRLAVTAVAAEECRSFDAFVRQLGQIGEWSGFQAVFGINRTWSFADIRRHVESGPLSELGRHIFRLAQDFRNRSYLDFQNALEHLGIWLSRHGGDLPDRDARHNIRQYVTMTLGVELPDAGWSEWIRILKERGENLLRDNAEIPNQQELVDRVLRYVAVRYMDNISLNQIACELDVNPSYLSTLFRKKTGITFVKYLTRLRMLKAKELLSGTDLPVREVAEQVGYYSTRHFTKLFVETVGVYPSDFRKSMAVSGGDDQSDSLQAPGGEEHVQ